MVVAPASTAALKIRLRNAQSLRVASSALNSTSSTKERASFTAITARSTTASGSSCNFFAM